MLEKAMKDLFRIVVEDSDPVVRAKVCCCYAYVRVRHSDLQPALQVHP